MKHSTVFAALIACAIATAQAQSPADLGTMDAANTSDKLPRKMVAANAGTQ